jgi:maltose/moltooligosaccharide transporter
MLKQRLSFAQIIKMMIVIPMIFQTLSFGYISKYFLNNNPGTAITFAGVFLLIAALATLRISNTKSNQLHSQPLSAY